MRVIGQEVKFNGFTGKVIYIYGVEQYGVLLENNTVDFVKSSCSGRDYLNWLKGEME
jgi:hypothetical protein